MGLMPDTLTHFWRTGCKVRLPATDESGELTDPRSFGHVTGRPDRDWLRVDWVDNLGTVRASWFHTSELVPICFYCERPLDGDKPHDGMVHDGDCYWSQVRFEQKDAESSGDGRDHTLPRVGGDRRLTGPIFRDMS